MNIKQVPSFQIFQETNKHKMKTRYPFLSHDQILSKLRKQWKQLDWSTRQSFSKLVSQKVHVMKAKAVNKKFGSSENKTSKSRHERDNLWTEAHMPKYGLFYDDESEYDNSYQEFNSCEIVNSPVMGKKITDNLDYESRLWSTSGHYSNDEPFKDEFDLNTNKKSVEATESKGNSFREKNKGLGKDRTYAGRAFELEYHIPVVYFESADHLTTGILKKIKQRNLAGQGPNRVSFSQFEKHCVLDTSCYDFDAIENGKEILHEDADFPHKLVFNQRNKDHLKSQLKESNFVAKGICKENQSTVFFCGVESQRELSNTCRSTPNEKKTLAIKTSKHKPCEISKNSTPGSCTAISGTSLRSSTRLSRQVPAEQTVSNLDTKICNHKRKSQTYVKTNSKQRPQASVKSGVKTRGSMRPSFPFADVKRINHLPLKIQNHLSKSVNKLKITRSTSGESSLDLAIQRTLTNKTKKPNPKLKSGNKRGYLKSHNRRKCKNQGRNRDNYEETERLYLKSSEMSETKNKLVSARGMLEKWEESENKDNEEVNTTCTLIDNGEVHLEEDFYRFEDEDNEEDAVLMFRTNVDIESGETEENEATNINNDRSESVLMNSGKKQLNCQTDKMSQLNASLYINEGSPICTESYPFTCNQKEGENTCNYCNSSVGNREIQASNFEKGTTFPSSNTFKVHSKLKRSDLKRQEDTVPSGEKQICSNNTEKATAMTSVGEQVVVKTVQKKETLPNNINNYSSDNWTLKGHSEISKGKKLSHEVIKENQKGTIFPKQVFRYGQHRYSENIETELKNENVASSVVSAHNMSSNSTCSPVDDNEIYGEVLDDDMLYCESDEDDKNTFCSQIASRTSKTLLQAIKRLSASSPSEMTATCSQQMKSSGLFSDSGSSEASPDSAVSHLSAGGNNERSKPVSSDFDKLKLPFSNGNAWLSEEHRSSLEQCGNPPAFIYDYDCEKRDMLGQMFCDAAKQPFQDQFTPAKRRLLSSSSHKTPSNFKSLFEDDSIFL